MIISKVGQRHTHQLHTLWDRDTNMHVCLLCMYTYCTDALVIFLLLQQNPWDSQLVRRRGLFWLTVWEVSVHGPLGTLLLGLIRQHITADVCDKGHCLPRSSQETERGRHQCPQSPWGHALSDLRSPTRSHLPVVSWAGNQAFNRRAFRDTYPNHSIAYLG
jgi:hypothetical protein